MKALVTGASGYIGGRLIPRLLEAGHEVRAMAREPSRLEHLPPSVEVVKGDVLDRESLTGALQDCDVGYYLIHTMGGGGSFEHRDREGAANFADAAARAGLRRIVYLGGLGSEREELSLHLTSRQEVGEILAAGPTPVTELRAAVIIGSGSVSFEMIRYLTEVLPAMTTPRWVRTRCQPIAISDVLDLLVRVIEDDATSDRLFEIGGPDVFTYEQMMQIYAQEAGLRTRLVIPVPVLSPGLSSLWVGLVTPLPVNVARPLIESLRNEVVVHDDGGISGLFPYTPIGYREAVRRALERTAAGEVETRWSDAARPARASPTDPDWAGGTTFRDIRQVRSTAPPEDLFWAFSRMGGRVGYYAFDSLWRIRGVVDNLLGGVGHRRGRRHPEALRRGDTLDFWRVAAVERDRRLVLQAEMRLPGLAWLEWTATSGDNGSTLEQTATFVPRGLLGRLYWLAVMPFHTLIFGTMARRIAQTAERREHERRESATESQ